MGLLTRPCPHGCVTHSVSRGTGQETHPTRTAGYNHDMTDADERWMRRTLELAERGRGYVEPNPLVGAVLVRDGEVIGEGWHRRYGEAHAEVEAIRAAGDRARGSTLYVTLEPCCHHGKTPP